MKIKYASISIALTFLCSLPITAWSAPHENSYVENVLTSMEWSDENVAIIKVKPQYQAHEEAIQTTLLWFDNYSAYSSGFGSAGDRPSSWEFSGCFIQDYSKDNKYFIKTQGMKNLVRALHTYGATDCRLSKIPSDNKPNKTKRMLRLAPAICKADYLNQYKTEKDMKDWEMVLKPTEGGYSEELSATYFEGMRRFESILKCNSRERYPSNALLEQSMDEYIDLFDDVVLAKDSLEDDNGNIELCLFTLAQIKQFKKGTILKSMAQECQNTLTHPTS